MTDYQQEVDEEPVLILPPQFLRHPVHLLPEGASLRSVVPFGSGSVDPHLPGFMGQHTDDVEEASEANLGALPGGEWATVKAFPRGKIPFPPYAEVTAAAKGCRGGLACSDVVIHRSLLLPDCEMCLGPG